MRRSLIIILAVMVLTGCNTMVNKTYQKIAVHTPGVENIDCIIESETNKYRLLAPGTVNVERSASPLTMTCQKVGYVTTSMTLLAKYRMVPAQLNVFNGIAPGLAYDFASRSVYAYPETVVMNMERDPSKLIPLEPRSVHVLPLKKEIVTPADVAEAKEEAEGDAGVGEAPDDAKADEVFNDSLRK